MIIELEVEKFDSKLGYIMGMAMLQPLILIIIAIILGLAYFGLRWLFNKEKIKAKSCEKEYCYDDLYLSKNIINSNLIDYQIINKKNGNAPLWNGRCAFEQGRLHSIILYSGSSTMEIVLEISKQKLGIDYEVKDNQAIIGFLHITNDGLQFMNADKKIIYTAILEISTDEGLGAVADWLLALDTLTVASSKSTTRHFIIKGESDEIVGKYYISLKNMDLSPDISNVFDRRIATLFALFFDASSNKSA